MFYEPCQFHQGPLAPLLLTRPLALLDPSAVLRSARRPSGFSSQPSATRRHLGLDLRHHLRHMLEASS